MDQSVWILIEQELYSQIGDDNHLLTSSQFAREVNPMSKWGLMLKNMGPCIHQRRAKKSYGFIFLQ